MKKINLIIIFMFIFSLMLKANVIEDEILRLINLERSKSSLPPIPNNERLHSIALYHSDNMANNNFICLPFESSPSKSVLPKNLLPI